MQEQPKKAVVLAPPRDVVVPAYPDGPATIPVFLGCDDNFLPHALAVIASVMTHASPENRYDLFIVQSGIPRGRMDAAAAWMERYPNATLRFVDIDPCLEKARGILPVTREYSVAVFFRIFAPSLFREYKRIAYLDSDIAVLDDVAGFYRLDLGGKTLGAVRDFSAVSQSRSNPAVADFWRTRLGKEPGSDYFNSGMLIMDLERMRVENVLERFLACAGELKGARLPDQDLINLVLDGDIAPLPAAWNCFDWMADEEEEAPNFRLLRADFVDELREARRKVKVIHFAEKKPWTMGYQGKFADKYWRYAAETPFHGELLERIRRECGPAKIRWRQLLTRMQEAHFAVRLRAAPAKKREKYAARLRNLEWRRKGLARQKAFVEKLLRGEVCHV